MMNGSQGIVPTLDVSGNNSNGGFFGGEGVWVLILLALLFSTGGFGGFGGGFGGMYEFPWLLTGQQGINNNTNQGFDTLHLSNQIEGVRDGIYSLSNQLCNCCADMNQTVSNGFFNAETSANARQIANMQQAFASQTAVTGAISNLSSDLASCCCENRLATCQTQNIVQNEGNATRFADANNTRDIITNATANTQAILDKLCQLELDAKQDKIDAKNEKIADLQRQLTMADLRASQTAQNAFISQGLTDEVDALYNRLNNCPVPTTPVYGRTPIFTCNNNNGCGCSGNNYYNVI